MLSCSYCGKPAVLVTGDQLYPHLPYLKIKSFWRCEPCDAHVGCHPNTTRPLGTLADSALRTIRTKAHREFDPLWTNAEDRKVAYAWLADKLQTPVNKCHIGMFDAAQCRKTFEECRKRIRAERGR